jgi:hypothetical protein
VCRMRRLKSLAGSMNSGTVTPWPVLIFALAALGGGLGAMAALSGHVVAGTITALVTAVLGVVGTHAGHVASQKLAAKQSATHPLADGLEKLVQLNKDGKLTDDELTKAKAKLLD